jgi:mono/diheme cytochrome c family protein
VLPGKHGKEDTMSIQFLRMFSLAAILVMGGYAGIGAEEKDPLEPRVPSDQRDEVNELQSPVEATEKVIAEGKELFEGKGTCFNCHGKSGKGDGPAGQALNPSPRDLTNCEFQDKRSDGELLWVIKNGIEGTGMASMVPGTLKEEEAWKIIAYMRTFCK